jgi:hypothetical protein
MNGALPEFACCALPEVPRDRRLEAAWHAACIRPANAPGLVDLAYDHPADEPLPPESITLLRAKFWPVGSVLPAGRPTSSLLTTNPATGPISGPTAVCSRAGVRRR